jgi:phytoene/squalene synthetase
MAFEASRARTRFAAAAAPRADFHALLPARIMRAVYEKILSELELAAFPVFERRVSLGTAGKLAAAASAFLQRRP